MPLILSYRLVHSRVRDEIDGEQLMPGIYRDFYQPGIVRHRILSRDGDIEIGNRLRQIRERRREVALHQERLSDENVHASCGQVAEGGQSLMSRSGSDYHSISRHPLIIQAVHIQRLQP
jgi:hypothetical protein